MSKNFLDKKPLNDEDKKRITNKLIESYKTLKLKYVNTVEYNGLTELKTKIRVDDSVEDIGEEDVIKYHKLKIYRLDEDDDPEDLLFLHIFEISGTNKLYISGCRKITAEDKIKKMGGRAVEPENLKLQLNSDIMRMGVVGITGIYIKILGYMSDKYRIQAIRV